MVAAGDAALWQPAPAVSGSVILSCFQEFYAEAARLRDTVVNGGGTRPAGGEAGTRAVDAAELAREINLHLGHLLERLDGEARRAGDEYARGAFRDALYAMAALADEMYLGLEWEGSEYWTRHLLEGRLFRSCIAGERLFERIETLLDSRDAATADLAVVYLLCIALGFRGRYRDVDDHGRLDDYRKRLFTFAFQHRPGILEQEPLFPLAGDNVLAGARVEQFPHLRWWLLLWGAVAVGLFAASLWIWDRASGDLLEIVGQLLVNR